MKKAIFIIMVFIGVSSCSKKVCFECTDIQGQVISNKCFNSEDDKTAYIYAEINKPESQRCK